MPTYIGKFPDCRVRMIEELKAGEEIEVDCEDKILLRDYLIFKTFHGVIKKGNIKNRWLVKVKM